MKCREASRLINQEALGDRGFQGSEELCLHLDECEACRAELKRARAVAFTFRTVKPAVPRELLSRITAASRQEIAVHRSGRRVRRLAFVAAMISAAALLIVAGMFFWRHDQAAATGDGGWCFVQGDPGNCRQGDLASGLVPDKVVWQRDIPGLPGQFKPIVHQGVVIVNAAPKHKTFRGGGRLIAFDAGSGTLRWEREFQAGDFYKATGFQDRCAEGGRFYVTDGQRCLVLEVATGRDVATHEPPAGASGWKYLSAVGNSLYGTSVDGKTVFSVDSTSGKCAWIQRLDGATFLPALAGGRLLLQTDKGTLLALSASDGSEVWRAENSAPAGQASLHARSDRGVVLADSGEIMAFDARDGRTIWRKKLEGPASAGLAMNDVAVYLQGGNRALALADGFTLWYQDPKDTGGCSAPTVVGQGLLASPGPEDGKLAVMSSSGQVLGTIGLSAGKSCDGAVVEHGRVFTVGDGCLLAVSCRSRG